MGLLDFFANRGEETYRQTGPDYKEEIWVGPFGERKEKRTGQYREANKKRTDQNSSQQASGLFGLFSNNSESPQIGSNQSQKQLKPKK